MIPIHIKPHINEFWEQITIIYIKFDYKSKPKQIRTICEKLSQVSSEKMELSGITWTKWNLSIEETCFQISSSQLNQFTEQRTMIAYPIINRNMLPINEFQNYIHNQAIDS